VQRPSIIQALAAGSAAGARSLARDHVLASFRLLDAILRQVGTQARPRALRRGRG